MVVEDDPTMAAETVEALASIGYDVTCAVSSALEAMESAKKRRPDLVLMDISLSGDLDGIDAARMLRERFDVPVVFLSGYADYKTITRAKLAGALGYLVKPFRWKELEGAVEVGLFRHQLECELRDRERWLSTTLQAVGDAAVAVDGDGRVAFMNAIAEELIKQPEAAVRGRPLSSLLHLLNENTREPIADPVPRALQAGALTRLPLNVAAVTGGREVPVAYSVAPMSDDQGKICGAVAVIKDLTEQRQAQQQVAVADRLASLGVVTAGIAHEINNPLTYVLGNIEFLAEEIETLRRTTEPPVSPAALDTVRECIQGLGSLVREVQTGAWHVARIVADLSSFSRRDTDPQPCDVVERLEWALRVSHSAIVRHARIKRIFLPVPRARVNEGRLGQVFLNLFLNAAYAMRDTDASRNELTVSVATAPQGKGEVIRIAIADTGCGMTADVLKRIFDPFFTTKPPGVGTGLGLSVCQGMVAEMGGEITVTSTPGKGSCFVLHLPVADAPPLENVIAGALLGLRGRVLVIDDDARVLTVVHRMLSSIHDVVTIASARDALDLLQNEAFDVIICDLLMPDMSGMDFYRKVATTYPDVAWRIIFLSGGANAELATAFFATVPNVALQKPPSKVQLLRAIELQLTAAGSASASGSSNRGPDLGP